MLDDPPLGAGIQHVADCLERYWKRPERDDEKLIERMTSRDELKRKDAVQRLSCQMPLKEKIEYADHVIYNKATIEETLKQVGDIFADLSKTLV